MSYVNHAFIGREKEVGRLQELRKRKKAAFVVLRGRRRIGKSRMVKEFAHGQVYYNFTGIAPNPKTTAQTQRDEFMRQFGEHFGLSGIKLDDWGDIFTLLVKQVSQSNAIVFFDEISWMASGDPTFSGKLKNAWDLGFSRNSNLMLILCGSVSSWIEKNIINSTAFLGRPNCYMVLKELPLDVCNQFWGKFSAKISAFEKLKMLSVTGGVPRYLELLDVGSTAEDNIRQLLFLPDSPLLKEFDRIFSDIFGKRSDLYREIISKLIDKSLTLQEIIQACGRKKTGDFSEYLEDLVLAGFVERDYTWQLSTGKVSRLSKFRLKDNFLRFYLKYVKHNVERIEKGLFVDQSLSSLPGWNSIIALQFENLVLNNQIKLLKHLNINAQDVVFMNPYFQNKTRSHKGCQIDLLIQTKFNNVYVCEIKFSKNAVGKSVIDEVEEKVKRLALPRYFSYRPVLIHVNDVSDQLLDEQYFSHIIDFSELLD